MRSLASFAVFLFCLLSLACTSKQPAAPPAGDSVAGARTFQSACAVCHTTTDQKKVGPGLGGLYKKTALPNAEPVSDPNVENWIRNGGGNMPGFKGALNDEQMRDLIAYLKTL